MTSPSGMPEPMANATPIAVCAKRAVGIDAASREEIRHI
ncbi:hypothetical protein NIES4073_61750 [Kalymmatonema gypsitolerans NIES-4073]|nr:hypothetical protein SAMD00079811_28200 [Scytonema sp. HK-05]BAZ25271.1 hypothetical protein NIES4073_61750 [Scytonema sp. NIES-4073]